MKLESLVIVGQPYHGEYVLGSCTQIKDAWQFITPSGANPLPVSSTGRSLKQVQLREEWTRGLNDNLQRAFCKQISTHAWVVVSWGRY